MAVGDVDVRLGGQPEADADAWATGAVVLEARRLRVAPAGRASDPPGPGDWVVAGADLALRAGTRLALVGERGAGKTALLRALAGMLPVGWDTVGDLHLDGRPTPWRRPGRREERQVPVVLLGEDPALRLDPRRRCEPQILEGLRHRPASREETDTGRRERAAELAAEVGLGAQDAGRYPDELPPEARRRAALAVVLAWDPQVVLLDEPGDRASAAALRQAWDILVEAPAARATALVLASRDARAAGERASDIVVLHRGRIVETGPARAVLDMPAHPCTATLVGLGQALARRGRPTSPGGVGGENVGPVPEGACPFVDRCPLAGSPCRRSVGPPTTVLPGRTSACILGVHALTGGLHLRPAGPPRVGPRLDAAAPAGVSDRVSAPTVGAPRRPAPAGSLPGRPGPVGGTPGLLASSTPSARARPVAPTRGAQPAVELDGRGSAAGATRPRTSTSPTSTGPQGPDASRHVPRHGPRPRSELRVVLLPDGSASTGRMSDIDPEDRSGGTASVAPAGEAPSVGNGRAPAGAFAGRSVSADRGSRRSAPSVLLVRGLTVTRPGDGEATIRGVDLEIHAGERVGLVGAPGSGKTMLVRCLVGLHRPDCGLLDLAGGEDVPARRGRGAPGVRLVPADPGGSLDPSVDVGALLAEALGRPAGPPGSTAVLELADLLGLSNGRLERRSRDLSHEERLLVAVGRAVAAGPRLLVCDDPLTGLDAPARLRFGRLVDRLVEQRGTAVLLTGRDGAALRGLIDRMLRLGEGNVSSENHPPAGAPAGNAPAPTRGRTP